MSETTQIAERKPAAVTQREGSRAARQTPIVPPVDIYENSQGVTLWADLPGVSKDQLEVRVQDGNLHIEAEATVPTPPDLRLQYSEIRQPRFVRTFALSSDFDTSKIDANLQDGLLKVTIPRRAEAQPRRIEVKVS
jgi:HSP20 family protein